MDLNEREKIIYITSHVKAMIDDKILEDGMDQDTAVAAGKKIMAEMFNELGLRPQKGMFAEILKFERELNVISGILNKEDELMG